MNELSDDEVMTAPPPQPGAAPSSKQFGDSIAIPTPAPARELSDDDVMQPAQPESMSASAKGDVKLWVEPALKAFGQGFREGFGPDRLGLTDDSVKWLSKVGIFAPEGQAHYNSPFYAFNELLAETLWRAPEIVFRTGGGLLRAGQAAVAAVGEVYGQKALGREVAAIPEAFFGSPHPTGIPKLKAEPPVRRVTGGLDDAPSLPVARDLGVIGPERPSIAEGTPVEAAKAVAPPIEAYHGSPYSFDSFSMEKIGEGEGAQSYGHGLYFAENPEVAKGYRARLAKDMGVSEDALKDPEFGPKLEAAKREQEALFEKFADAANSGDDALLSRLRKETDDHHRYMEGIEQEANEKYPPGAVYQVRIHADKEAMLDWDKPLKDQPGALKAFETAWKETGEPAVDWKGKSVGDAYDALAKLIGGDGASQALRDQGIPGIRYLDQGSRRSVELQKIIDQSISPDRVRLAKEELAQLKETRNFVVFDDGLVEITHRNGEPVEPPPSRTMAAEQKRPEVKTQEVGGGEPPAPVKGVTDKAGNIRLDLIDKPEDVLNVIRAAAEEQGGDIAFNRARNGDIPLAQIDALGQATGMDPSKMDVRGMSRLMRNDNEVRLAIQAMIQSAEDTSAAMKRAAASDTPADLIEFQRLRMRHSILQEQVAGLTAEWGRTGNVFQEFAERAKDAKGLGEFLKDKKGETIDDLRQMAKAGSVLDRGQMAKFLNDARHEPPSLMYWTWVNGLISGVMTHTKYIGANALYAGLERGVVTPFAALIGKAKEIAGVEAERVFFGEALASVYGHIAATPGALIATAKSIKAGIRAPLESEVILRDAAIARGEKVPAALARSTDPGMNMRRPTHFRIPIYDKLMGNEERPINAIYGRIIGSPGDAAMGIHTFFKIIGERAGIEEQAYRATVKEGLNPTEAEFWERRAYHSANPTEAMRKEAVEGAYKGTFMQELGPHGKRWQNLTKKTPVLKWLFPFSHIPLNLMKATYEGTPFALRDSEMRANIMGKNGGVAQDKAIARMVVGSSVMGYMTNLYMQGRATGDYPTDPKERDAWKLQGKQPNSILLGNYWVSYDRFGPAGSLAHLGASFGEVIHHLKSGDDDAMTHATSTAALAAAHVIVNEVGMLSLQNLFEAIHDEKKGAAWAANTAGSFIPFSSFLGQNASFMDPHMRETKTFLDGIKNRIPLVRETLLPKRDWSGTPIDNPLYHDIIRKKAVNNDPVDRELDTLKIHPAPPENRIGGVKLPPKLYDIYQSTAGPYTRQTLQSMVTRPGWHDLPPFVREETIRAVIRSTRESAAAAMQASYPQIIQKGVENRVNHITGAKPTPLRE